MKGIVLAGGSGTRLHPITLGVCKQLLPVYNKPMIYYPLSLLLLANIKEILIITTPEDQMQFQRLLGDGSKLGISLSYAVQDKPNGLAEAFIIGRDFVGKDSVALVLGDNIFYGNHLGPLLQKARERKQGATLFGYQVKDPERYGVVEMDSEGNALSLEEKPKNPKSNIAVTGLYFYDNQVLDIAKGLKPSPRGELEITDVNKEYLARGQAYVNMMGRGFAWLDAGTYESLMQASHFVQVIEERQGHCIASLEEIAYRQKFITQAQLRALGEKLGKSGYGKYLSEIVANEESLVK
ncbi:Glucose-1-phosphate thymidylyltransferase [Chlamydiales bacterium STE3]|nr:Glucose-1-phosphate thymidylyltransferase [Chlamydiales bacterium STE3]